MPDSDGGTLDRVLAAEGAGVGGVLGDLHLLDRLAESRSVTDTVLSGHSCLSGPIDLKWREKHQSLAPFRGDTGLVEASGGEDAPLGHFG